MSTISLRLDDALDTALEKYADILGRSKSDVIRSLVRETVSKPCGIPTPWELGKEVFGIAGSGRDDLSVNRKNILREKLRAKKSRH